MLVLFGNDIFAHDDGTAYYLLDTFTIGRARPLLLLLLWLQTAPCRHNASVSNVIRIMDHMGFLYCSAAAYVQNNTIITCPRYMLFIEQRARAALHNDDYASIKWTAMSLSII